MRMSRRAIAVVFVGVALGLSACSAPTIDLSTVKRPDRSPELDAYDMFVGSWTWEATLVNAEGEGRDWNGTARWRWSLDNRCLQGDLHLKGADAEYDAIGMWSWHPKKHRYFWSMFNDWEYPQQGTASYDEASKTWEMNYKSVGLDGTTSYGRHVITVVDQNTLDWHNQEWVDPMHLFPKVEWKGVYKRVP